MYMHQVRTRSMWHGMERVALLVIEDVKKFPGHIACSSLSRSEIVVLLKHNGVLVGEIDIDSTQLSTFDDEDRIYIE